MRRVYLSIVSTLAEIEAAIEQLPASQVEKLAAWLDQRRLGRKMPALVSEPDFLARAKAIWGENPPGEPLSAIISDSRGGEG